jgi:hypothetical protein
MKRLKSSLFGEDFFIKRSAASEKNHSLLTIHY